MFANDLSLLSLTRTMLDQTIVLQTNGETSAQTQTSMVNGYFCTVHTDGQGPLTTYPSASSSSKYITSSSTAALARPAISEHAQTTGPASSALSPPPTIYSRDKSRKTKTGEEGGGWGGGGGVLESERGQ